MEGQPIPDGDLHQRLGDAQPATPLSFPTSTKIRAYLTRRTARHSSEPRHGAHSEAGSDRRDRQLLGLPASAVGPEVSHWQLADATSVAMENVRVYSELGAAGFRSHGRAGTGQRRDPAVVGHGRVDEAQQQARFYLLAELPWSWLGGVANCLLAFLDVDGLKRVNDEHGHEMGGNQLITDVADVLQVTLRRSDIVARLGGDEFCVMVTERGRSHHAAGRLLRGVRSSTRPTSARTTSRPVSAWCRRGPGERHPRRSAVGSRTRRCMRKKKKPGSLLTCRIPSWWASASRRRTRTTDASWRGDLAGATVGVDTACRQPHGGMVRVV